MKKMRLLFILAVIVSSPLTAQENLLVDGGFENQTVYSNQIPRIASFNDYNGSSQTANPALSQAVPAARGVWFRKAPNSGYQKAIVTTSDKQEGSKSISLSIGSGSGQANLHLWYNNTLVQYVQIDRTKKYNLKLYAKNTAGCDSIFAGLTSSNGEPVSGSQWIKITSSWKEYSININPAAHPNSGHYTDASFEKSAVVIGQNTSYNEAGKTKQPVEVLIDNVRLYEGEDTGGNNPPQGGEVEILKQTGFENTAPGTSIVVGTDPYGSALLNKWNLVVKNNSSGTGVITTEDKHEGLQALKVQLENIDYRYRFFLAQEVENAVPSEYTFSMWAKADVDDIPFRIDVLDGKGNELFKTEKRTVADTWTNYTFTVDLSAYSAADLKIVRFAIRPNCYNGGSIINTPAVYFFDDISCIGRDLPEAVLFEPKPYLQSKTQNSILINWLSAAGEEGVPVVEYGTSDLSLTASGSMKAVSNTVWSGVSLSGLSADTEYQYRCRVGSNVSAVYKFRTLPEHDTNRKIRFISFGDSHEASSTIKVRESALAKLKELYGEDIHNHIDFAACTGDIVYLYGQNAGEFGSIHFEPNEKLSCVLPYNIAAGNHDFEKNDSEHSYFYDYMNYEALSDAPGAAKGKYYAQQVGNALFVYLNSNKQYLCGLDETNQTYAANCEAQMNWLAEKLTSAESDQSIDMIFLFLHHGYRYETWSDPKQNTTAEKIKDRLYPVMNLSTKIKTMQYGHTHAVECGILDLDNGSSTALFLNGNAGSYPDYFGRYEEYVNYPEIHRSMEHIGFAITEIDPAVPSYTTTYYAVMQRRVVEGGSSTAVIRSYDPAEAMTSWGYDASRPAPAAPAIESVVQQNGNIEIEASFPGSVISVNYRIETAAGAAVIDTVFNFEDVFGTTGYITKEGALDLSSAYLPLDLNAGVDLTRFSWPVDSNTQYIVKVRWRNSNFEWSSFAQYSSGPSTGLNADERNGINVCRQGNMLEVKSEDSISIELIDSSGIVLQTAECTRSTSYFNISTCRGVYFLRFKGGNSSGAVKIVL